MGSDKNKEKLERNKVLCDVNDRREEGKRYVKNRTQLHQKLGHCDRMNRRNTL